jgi:hypothetical protein
MMKNDLLKLEAEMQSEAKNKESRKDADLQCKVLQLLLNPDITSFQFPLGLDMDNQDAVTELWQGLLDLRPPNLHTIICRCTEYESWDVRSFFNSLLPVFPNLEVLRLDNFDCNDQDLYIIADHLPKLRSVEFSF